ncbi:RNA chaperone Hfq [Candidatus Sumerlaeota bacterium]|nr:RNA chaperone Hfq [Candidatus Sumerlaeota bacterium]
MAKTVLNLQDSFLNQVRKDGTEVKVVMLDGSVLTGKVKGFDNFTVIINSEGKQYLLYKHAVSQIVTSKNTRDHYVKESNSTNKKTAFNPIDLSRAHVSNKQKKKD